MRCKCGVSTDDGLPLIQCDTCHTWSHLSCEGLTHAALPDTFTCTACVRQSQRGGAIRRTIAAVQREQQEEIDIEADDDVSESVERDDNVDIDGDAYQDDENEEDDDVDDDVEEGELSQSDDEAAQSRPITSSHSSFSDDHDIHAYNSRLLRWARRRFRRRMAVHVGNDTSLYDSPDYESDGEEDLGNEFDWRTEESQRSDDDVVVAAGFRMPKEVYGMLFDYQKTGT